jgi:hypothetical protein
MKGIEVTHFFLNPLKKGKCGANQKIRSMILLYSLYNTKKKIMRFLKDPRVSSENKPAEREIRMMKVDKKYQKFSEPKKEEKLFAVLKSIVLQSERTVCLL